MPTQMAATEQKTLVEDIIVRGVDGLAISPIDPKNQTTMLNELADKVKLVCTDSDAPKSKRVCYIGTSNLEAGLVAGAELRKALPNGGKVMMFVPNFDLKNCQERMQGVREAIKGSNIKIIGVMTDNGDRTKCIQNAEDCLTKHGDVAAMVGIAGSNGPACAEALKAAHKVGKVKIVCFDGEEEGTLQGIKDGVIEATVAQNPYKMGYESVRVMAALVRGEDPGIPPDGKINTGVTVVNKSNIDEHWDNLRRLKAKFKSREHLERTSGGS